MNGIRQKLIASFLAAGISASGAFVAYDLTLSSEGYEPTPYIDPVGLKTYCVGHLALKGEKVKYSYTDKECMDIFAADWKIHQAQLDSVVKVPYKSEWQKEALTDFTFNVGIGNVKSSTLIKLVNQGRHKAACEQLSKWVKAGGKTLKGLVTRRANTMSYCMGELSYDKQKAYSEFQKEYEAIKRQKENPEKL